MNTIRTLIATSVISAALLASAGTRAADKPAVGITPNMASVSVMHNGKETSITRNQDQNNTVDPAFAKTSRKCPPF